MMQYTAMTMEQAAAVAVFLAMVVNTIVEFLKAPLINTPFVADWMVRKGLAVKDEDGHVSIWWTPYVTFICGIALSIIFQVNIVPPFIPDAPYWPSLVLTGLIVGGGSNIIYQIVPHKSQS